MFRKEGSREALGGRLAKGNDGHRTIIALSALRISHPEPLSPALTFATLGQYYRYLLPACIFRTHTHKRQAVMADNKLEDRSIKVLV